jgi:hypothetical protein
MTSAEPSLKQRRRFEKEDTDANLEVAVGEGGAVKSIVNVAAPCSTRMVDVSFRHQLPTAL